VSDKGAGKIGLLLPPWELNHVGRFTKQHLSYSFSVCTVPIKDRDSFTIQLKDEVKNIISVHSLCNNYI